MSCDVATFDVDLSGTVKVKSVKNSTGVNCKYLRD